MKKTFSLIYRFIFILFSVWSICGTTGMSIFNLTPNIFDFTLYVNVLCFLVVLILFLISINTYPKKIMIYIKSVATMLSAVVFVDNLYLISTGVSYAWILGVLLPLMMIIDWLLFDKKGNINFSDVLWWIIGAIILSVLHKMILKGLLKADFYGEFLGIFKNKDELFNMLLKLLGTGFFMLLGDGLMSGFKNKIARGIWVLLYRIVFLMLEVYALMTVVGNELTSLILEFKYFHILINFLAMIVMALVLIYNILKFKNFKKHETPYPRLKCGISVSMLLCLFTKLIFGEESYNDGFYNMILFYICPLMLLFDWIMFEKKGEIKLTDPFLWLILPFLYFSYVVSFVIPKGEFIYNVLLFPQPEMFLGFGFGIVAIGYLIYFADRLMKRR